MSGFPKISRKSLVEAFFTIGGRIGSVFIIIASTKFLTTFLSEADYGQLALYNITAILPSTFYFGPVTQGIMRFFPIAREREDTGAFRHQFHRMYKWGAFATMSAGVVSSFACWCAGEKNWAYACLIIAALNIVNAYNTTWYGLQNIARKRSLALGLEVGDRLLQQAAAILLLLFVFRDPLAVITGYLIASLIFLVINRHYYRKSFPQNTESALSPERTIYAKDVLQYSWPFIVIGIFFWIQNASERWTLEVFQSTEIVGQFAVLSQIGFQALSLIFTSINYFLYPILINIAGGLNNDKRFHNANLLNNYYLLFIFIFSMLTLILSFLFKDFIIWALTDEKYLSISPLLPAMVIAAGLFNFGQYYTHRYILSLQSKLLMRPKVATSIVGLFLNLGAAYRFGLKGLILSIIVTQVFYISILVFYWEKEGVKNFELSSKA